MVLLLIYVVVACRVTLSPQTLVGWIAPIDRFAMRRPLGFRLNDGIDTHLSRHRQVCGASPDIGIKPSEDLVTDTGSGTCKSHPSNDLPLGYTVMLVALTCSETSRGQTIYIYFPEMWPCDLPINIHEREFHLALYFSLLVHQHHAVLDRNLVDCFGGDHHRCPCRTIRTTSRGP